MTNRGRLEPLRVGTAGLGLAIVVLFVVSNFALSGDSTPTVSASAEEIAEFYGEHRVELQWDAGMRFVELFVLPFFVFGLVQITGRGDVSRGLLETVALVGTGWVVAVGTVANTMHALLILEADRATSEPELVRMINLGVNGLFTAVILAHALWIGSVCELGRRTSSLPRWLWALGFVQVAGSLIGGIGLTQALAEGNLAEAGAVIGFAVLGLWVLAVSIYLLGTGARRVSSD